MATTLTGIPASPAQDLFTSSTVQNGTLGVKVFSRDGRGFRYVRVGGTALVRGKLYVNPAEDTTNYQELTITNATAGDTTITTTDTVTLVANQLAGGYLQVSEGTNGVSQVLRIKSHPAATAAVVTFTLEDAVQTTTTGTCKVDVLPDPYNGVVISPATNATGAPIGVAVYDAAASTYAYLQVSGPCSVLAAGALIVGNGVVPSTATAGAVTDTTTVPGDAMPTIGVAMTGAASTDRGWVDLKIS